MKNSYRFFQNRECEYFPCHKVADDHDFNCQFCYCPLYTLGAQCGGNFSYTEDGIKDCTACMIPHSLNGHDYISSKFGALAQLAKEKRKDD